MADTEIVPVKAETPIRKVEKVAEKVVEKVAEKVAATAEAAPEPVKSGLKDVQAKVATSLNRVAEVARTVTDAQRGTLETAVKAGQIYGEGLQGIAKRAAEVSRTQYKDTLAHLRALTGVKSVREAIELQTAFARNTASRVLSESSNFAEDYLKVAGEALAPVTTLTREAAEKVKKAA